MIDLHVHTNKSDGEYAPLKIVKMAKDNNVDVLAITDHDTVDGVLQVSEYAKQLQMELIPGIEISAKDNQKEVHILGYYIDYNSRELKEFCNKNVEQRNIRNRKYVEMFNELGVNITYDEVAQNAKTMVVSKIHFADLLLKKGYTTYFREAFKKYFNKKSFKDIKADSASVIEAIDIIKKAGGIPVLAHPKVLNWSQEVLEDKINMWSEAGLEGIECFYTGHTNSEQKQYLQIAKKYNLVVTGRN